MPKIISILTVSLAFAIVAGCGGKPKEVSQLARDQAAKHYSDAGMEMLLRNYAAAEKSLAQAAKLNPGFDDYWIDLGKMRVRLGDKSGAKDAYKGALAACEAQLKQNADNLRSIDRKVCTLVLLNRADDARAFLAKAAKDFPKNNAIQQLNQMKAVDRFLAAGDTKDFIVK